ncbi:phosphotransferase [Corynebacterium epidermidicanis]|uniref:Uncharacterized protein n=1 Tax=Corynebacterium epidermidicanis TaxID=1050174 RepID=A0A0G3GR55_9CORY|nr:phosphotransferase [Corynebacterium epidermidicanis]AKK03646.1 hypothetical protein CEPID_09000 [Corynebacterium epidermidicanis]
MYDDIANARFFRAKSSGISSFSEVKRAGNWVIADIDGDLYQLVLDGERDILTTEATTAEMATAFSQGNAFGAGHMHALVDDLLPPHPTPKVSGAEQSNTSIIFGEVMVKFFRKLEPGINPDVELLAGLARVNCSYAPRLRGYTTVDVDGVEYVTAMLQDFVADAREGWELTLARAQAGAELTGEATLMGEAVAAVHRDLKAAFGSEMVSNESIVAGLAQRVDTLVAQAPVLSDYAEAAQKLYARAAEGNTEVQRIHGDLHLGQILRTTDRYLLIDFEGEPARPLAERRELMSPLQDIAGMLRSFDYASQVAGTKVDLSEPFLTSAGISAKDPLLAAFVLDKALYEVAYEANNRPDWVPIPLGAVERLTQPFMA